jgi:hypothetical protein
MAHLCLFAVGRDFGSTWRRPLCMGSGGLEGSVTLRQRTIEGSVTLHQRTIVGYNRRDAAKKNPSRTGHACPNVRLDGRRTDATRCLAAQIASNVLNAAVGHTAEISSRLVQIVPRLRLDRHTTWTRLWEFNRYSVVLRVVRHKPHHRGCLERLRSFRTGF